MKKYLVAAVVIALATSANAQNNSKADFDNFRASALSGFSTFRNSVHADYKKFLDGVWEDFNTFRGVKPYSKPKPQAAPVASSPVLPEKPDIIPAVLPENDTPAPEKKPQANVNPSKPVPSVPSVPTVNPENSNPSPYKQPDVQPSVQPEARPAAPSVPVVPSVPSVSKATVTLSMYGLNLRFTQVNVGTIASISSNDISDFWGTLLDSELPGTVTKEMQTAIKQYRLGDWATYQMAKRYATKITSDQNTAMVITQFLLVHLGVDARVAIANGSNVAVLLPFDHMIYARTYITMPDDTKFYVFQYDEHADTQTIRTYKTNNNSDNLRPMDLVLTQEPLLPRADKPFSFGTSRIKISGNLNTNLIAMMDGYPQMPVPCFAKSVGQTELRQSVVNQIKQQVQGMSTLDAVNAILQFSQAAFRYATDDQQFGYEKPFFFEETLYYPKSDCEDRAVLHSYLLRNVLGLDSELVHFPGHEAACVALPNPINGTGYKYNNKVYYISDPCYIGAPTGLCMPQYRSTAPEIQAY